MEFINFIIKYEKIINLSINFFVAIGTIGSAVIALHLGYKDSHPKLRTSGSISILMPTQTEFLQFWCVNEGKQPVILKSFSFNPNKIMRQPSRLMILNPIHPHSTELPKMLAYSDDAIVYYPTDSLNDSQFKKFLGSYRWLAKLKLKYFWCVIANTNIGSFEGDLYDSLIDKILSFHFPIKNNI